MAGATIRSTRVTTKVQISGDTSRTGYRALLRTQDNPVTSSWLCFRTDLFSRVVCGVSVSLYVPLSLGLIVHSLSVEELLAGGSRCRKHIATSQREDTLWNR